MIMADEKVKVRIGKPQMTGPAIDKLHLWREENNAPKAQPSVWMENLANVHGPFFSKHVELFKKFG